MNNIHCIHELNCLQGREEGGYEYTRNKCDTKVSMGCAHTHVQGCGESRDENAEPAPKGVYHKCGSSNPTGRRVFSVVEHREAWARGF